MIGKFKSTFAHDVFHQKYAITPNETWEGCCRRVVDNVCGPDNVAHTLMSKDDREQLIQYMIDMKFIPGGRYLYYAGRSVSFYNNCFTLKAEEDTREEWGSLANRATSCLMSGGGIGVDYSILRPSGRTLSRTGGISSGPIPLMFIVNEIGRHVMQGGSRRSAIWAGLNWQHEDITQFLHAKDWSDLIKLCKEQDFNFPAPLDMTNISVQFDDNLDLTNLPQLWYDSVKQMCMTGEPGHSYNFGEHGNEICRNACTEFISEHDSDVCNLGSINFGNIGSIEELKDVVSLASKFLVCGSVRADLPYDKVRRVREHFRKIGLGLMGLHEWLLQRNYKYEMNDELRQWLEIYSSESERSAKEHSQRLFISEPIRFRAVAPSGTIGILASTTTGIEPLFAVAYKRRYLSSGTKWKHRYVIDNTAQRIMDTTGVNSEAIETAYSLSSSLEGIEKRVRMQYEVQRYVDMGISSTINLGTWGEESNNEGTSLEFAKLLARYSHGLRGITCYPNGSRGGQPLTEVPYSEAKKHHGMVWEEEDTKGCVNGVCGL